jgi:hypothetical protein
MLLRSKCIYTIFRGPKTMAKVGTTGIRTFLPFKGDPDRYAIAFRNGAVGVYHLKRRKLEY